jgi:hypothetical protein
VNSRYVEHRPIPRSCWVAALALLVAGCTLEPPAEPPGSANASPAPRSGDLRYDPIDSTLCDGMDLEDLFTDLGVNVHESRSAPGVPPGDVESDAWFATCQFEFEADGSPPLADGSSDETGVVVTGEPGTAYDTYRREVDLAERTNSDATIERVDGWWTEGTATEEFWDGASGPRVRTTYYLYHENLRLRTDLILLFEDDETGQEAATTIARRMARALVDEAVGLVPCEPLGDAPPATHCARP